MHWMHTSAPPNSTPQTLTSRRDFSCCVTALPTADSPQVLRSLPTFILLRTRLGPRRRNGQGRPLSNPRSRRRRRQPAALARTLGAVSLISTRRLSHRTPSISPVTVSGVLLLLFLVSLALDRSNSTVARRTLTRTGQDLSAEDPVLPLRAITPLVLLLTRLLLASRGFPTPTTCPRPLHQRRCLR